jgi:hypothetical protein
MATKMIDKYLKRECTSGRGRTSQGGDALRGARSWFTTLNTKSVLRMKPPPGSLYPRNRFHKAVDVWQAHGRDEEG